MRRLFSYIKSHIYDIHAILAATFAVFLLYLIKKPIKKYLESCLDKWLQKYPEKKEKRELYRKRYNMILIVLAIVMSFVLFGILSVLSPMIHFSVQSALMSGVFALCEYAFIDQITFRMPEE